MLVDFNTLPENSKIWIYQSDRKFYPQEIEEISQKVETFLNSWSQDNEDITASYQIKYNRFIIFAVDTSNISLSIASIDASVMLIINLQSEYKIELLDKLNVCFNKW